MNEAGAYENSNLFGSTRNSDFFSACLFFEICLQSAQGCLPSKVRSTACGREVVRRFSASMVVQATDWSTNQCAPMAVRHATSTSTWPIRLNTTAVFERRAPVPSEDLTLVF